MQQETTPLLRSSNVGGSESSSKYYFLNKSNEDYAGGASDLVRDGDGAQVVEQIPMGTSEQEFAPKYLPPVVCVRSSCLQLSRDLRSVDLPYLRCLSHSVSIYTWIFPFLSLSHT